MIDGEVSGLAPSTRDILVARCHDDEIRLLRWSASQQSYPGLDDPELRLAADQLMVHPGRWHAGTVQPPCRVAEGAATARAAYDLVMRLIDSHCHLNADRFGDDVELVLGGARLAGVERILVPGWNVASSARALGLVERFDWLDVAVGVHPHDADKVDGAGWRQIVAWARDERVVAIGETGLDYDRVFSPIPDQLDNLRRNLALALETGKPAILHCRSANGRRDAQDALLDELQATGIGSATWAAAFGSRPPAIIHSYSGPVDYARSVMDLGLAISFSGLVFRAGEDASAAVASLVPLDRLLVETDSPFLSPPGAPRKRNEPEWVAVTATWLGQQCGTDGEPLGDALVTAYDRTFARASRSAPQAG
jgi:TatD DNase family protein